MTKSKAGASVTRKSDAGFNISVYLPKGKRGGRVKLFKEVDRIAAKLDRSRSYIVNEALAQFCDRHDAAPRKRA